MTDIIKFLGNKINVMSFILDIITIIIIRNKTPNIIADTLTFFITIRILWTLLDYFVLP